MELKNIFYGAAALSAGACLWLLLRPFSESKTAEPPKLAPGDLVLLLGDSHAVGLDGRYAGDLGSVIKGRSNGQIGYAAVPVGGTGAPYWKNHIGPVLAQYKPKVVVLSLGGNDFQFQDPALTRAGINTIVSSVRAAGATLVWLEPTIMPMPDNGGVRKMWQEMVDEGLVTKFPWLSLEPLPRVSDNIHLTTAGYKTSTDAIGKWLLPG